MSMRALLVGGLSGAALLSWAMQVNAAGEGRRCGGRADIKCERGLWCEPRPGTCGMRLGAGTCAKVPQVCTMIYKPVCGCDGTTYSNDCVRRGQRVAKKHDGEC